MGRPKGSTGPYGSRLSHHLQWKVRIALAAGQSFTAVAANCGVSRDQVRTIARDYDLLPATKVPCEKCGVERWRHGRTC